MYTVLLAGGIGSGKSTVARELEALGCRRIDLDQLSREVLRRGSKVLQQIADAFGSDVVSPKTGELNRRLLAERAFATQADAERLEAIELPAIRALLAQRLEELASSQRPPEICVVEVPLLDRMGEGISLADEVLVVSCPLELRRKRAIERGMDGDDFDARVANQPSDEWLRAHATCVIENDGSYEDLVNRVRRWYDERTAVSA